MKDREEFVRRIHQSIDEPERGRPQRGKRKKKRKFSKFLIALTFIAQVFVSGMICWGLLRFGPFVTTRNFLIGTAMSTYSHQYIAKMLFSQKQIDMVVNAASDVTAETQNLNDIKQGNYSSNAISLAEINSQNGSYHGYLLEITNPLRVKVAYTKNLGKVGEATSKMAKDHNAIAAINGGGFFDDGWTGTGSLPTYYLIMDGKVAWKDPNYQESDPKKLPVAIGLDNTGTLVVGRYTLAKLQSMNVQYAVTMAGYEPLVVNGKGSYKNDGGRGYQPRTVIGQRADKTILMLVLDGRRINMKGASLLDAQKIMLDHGAVTAANLDGGNSTTMYYDGDVINQPSGDYGERTVATAFYVQP